MMTCAPVFDDGFSSTGFMSVCGAMPAARACKAWARPISAPSAVTALFKAIFCGLNGATETPRRFNSRHRAATTVLLPASEVVPCTIRVENSEGVLMVFMVLMVRLVLPDSCGAGGPVRLFRTGQPCHLSCAGRRGSANRHSDETDYCCARPSSMERRATWPVRLRCADRFFRWCQKWLPDLPAVRLLVSRRAPPLSSSRRYFAHRTRAWRR